MIRPSRFGHEDASRLLRVVAVEAEELLGYSRSRGFIHVFIAARKEYREHHVTPKLVDERAREEYNFRMNTYAVGQVRIWMHQEQNRLYKEDKV